MTLAMILYHVWKWMINMNVCVNLGSNVMMKLVCVSARTRVCCEMDYRLVQVIHILATRSDIYPTSFDMSYYCDFLDCPPDTYGVRCSQNCSCGDNGACDAARGCVCDGGWSGLHCDQGNVVCNTYYCK